jgi:predicted dehydrogenase
MKIVIGDRSGITRRSFFASAVLALPAVGGPASDKVRVAVIGLHGRGRDHIAAFQHIHDTEVALICDPDSEVLRNRAAHFDGRYGRKVETCSDLRRVLDRRDIDAVSIATPNHWHALAAIWACQAGKDVYVEKPGSHNLFEGRKLIEAAARYNRIVQHGVQLRSSPALQEAVALLEKGVIGRVSKCRGLVYRSRPSIGRKADAPTPAGLDYDLWQGPALSRPFNPNIVHYNWHWRWPYGNGEIGNQGVHEADMCMWGLGAKTLPAAVSTSGKKYWDDDRETPDILNARYRLQSGQEIEMEMRPWVKDPDEGIPVGNIFYGTEGLMLVKGYDEFRVLLGTRREPGPKRREAGNHFANFIEAVRSRNRAIQNGPVETVHTSSALAHLANISYRLRRSLEFDPAAERFRSDTEADALIRREYRPPFVIPESI